MLITLFMGVVFAAGTVLIWKYDLNIWLSIAFPVVVAGVQFLICPAIIDSIYSVNFMEDQQFLSLETIRFIKDTCREMKMPVPRLGIIHDGNPNAFTYGHIPKDARLVVTTGLRDLLSEEELKAVIAHELGHIKHYDFILMTLVSLIPMILYQLYLRTKDKADGSFIVGLGAYIVYLLSGFIVLSFSRIREFYADSFSKSIIEDGEQLKKALIKIAYGTAKRDKKKAPKVSTMGFTNNIQNDAFMLTSFKGAGDGKLDKKLMRWDFKSLWGRWFELNSTHPLTAKRIVALTGEQIEGCKVTIKDLWKFIVEAAVWMLPWATFIIVLAMADWNSVLEFKIFKALFNSFMIHPLLISTLGLNILLRYYFSYRGRGKEQSIYELLSREDASPVKGIPAVIEGTVIGKGIPGLFFSEDLVVDDGTGIMLVDYRQPLRILEFLFGVFKAESMKESSVKVVGWYKRGMRPHFVCRYIFVNDRKIVSFNFILTQIIAYIMIIGGIVAAFI